MKNEFGKKDTIYLSKIPMYPPIERAESDNNYIKHVVCDGARFHTLHWDFEGSHCSEKNCIHNKKN
jgi:hypothetical protein